MQTIDRHAAREALALLVLRLGLAWFIFVWAANKLFATQQYVDLVKWIDGVEVAPSQVVAVAWAQIAVCALVAAGAVRPWSYGALTAMHAFTVSRRWEGFLDPFALNDRGFPVNRNQVIDLAVLGAMIALILLRHRDRWSVDAWRMRGRGEAGAA